MPRRIINAIEKIKLGDILRHFHIEVLNNEEALNETEPFLKILLKEEEYYLDPENWQVIVNDKEVGLGKFLLSEFGESWLLRFLSEKGYDTEPLFADNSLDFNLNGEKEVYAKYLSEQIIEKTYKNSIVFKECLLHADTGSGKTYGMVMNRPKGQKIVFLTPFKAQAEQCAREYNGIAITGKSGGYHYTRISQDIKDEPDVIFCVYDKFPDLIKAMRINGFNLENYVLVIDEFHQFLWDCSDEFRGPAIDYVLDNRYIFKSWIAITATPFGIKNNYFKKVISTKNTVGKSKMKGTLQVVELNTESANSNELIERLTQHIKENHIPETQTLVMCESKKQAENLSTNLHKSGFMTSYVTSENKGDSDVYSSIINESKIPFQYDILIFTPLIKSAVNIKSWGNKPLGNIHINLISHHKSNKYDIISQFPARARDGFENLYIYNAGKEYFKDTYKHSFIPKLYDISEEIDSFYQKRLKISNKLNDFKEWPQWEQFENAYLYRNKYSRFKVRLHQIIRQKYTPILHDAIMYNDDAIHYIMRQHNYSNIKETISLEKLSRKTNSTQDLIDNLNENLVYTILGLKKSLNTSELPKDFHIEWEDVPLKFKIDKNTGGTYKKKGKLLIDATKEGIVDSESLIGLLTSKKSSKDKKMAITS